MKGTIKLLSILMIAIMLVSVVSIPVHATTLSGQVTQLEDAMKKEENQAGTETDNIRQMVAKVINLIRNIAVIGGVLLLTIIGFKYMLGSAEEKADYKKSLIPLVVGIVVVMAASQIMSMIFGFLE